MARSLVSLSTLALACIGQVSAANWHLDETYDVTNFWSKFNFFESDFSKNDSFFVDPTHGYVWYRNEKDARKLGLIDEVGKELYLGPDYTSATDPNGRGRNSVRIESKALYTHGLFIARFTHLPKPTCGVWPAFWSYGDPWVTVGEVDMLEQWNDRTWNQPAIHTSYSKDNGTCFLDKKDQTSAVLTDNCDNYVDNPPIQYPFQGCTSSDTTGPYGSPEGGIYAMEWTKDYLKLYAWSYLDAPLNIHLDYPDTSTWGKPSVMLKNSKCDIDAHFARQKLVLNIDFCGDTAGNPYYWGEESKCATKTGKATCAEFVAASPKSFKNSYFKIKDIRVFSDTKYPQTSTTTKNPASSSTSKVTSSTAKPTTCKGRHCEESSSTGPSSTSSAEPTGCYGHHCEESSSTSPIPTSSSEPTGCHGYHCDEPSSTSSTDDTEPTGCDGYDCDGPSSTSSTDCAEPTDCEGYDCDEPTSSSSTDDSKPTSTEEEYTTSTVYTTRIYTETSCHPTKTNCPGKGPHVVTETVPLYTTVCPVTQKPKPTGHGGHGGPKGDKTSTYYITTTYTVTSCKPTVTKCHLGEVTTEVLATTYCPEDSPTFKFSTTTSTVTISRPKPTGGAEEACSGPGCPHGGYGGHKNNPSNGTVGASPTGGNKGCAGEGCPKVVSGAVSVSTSLVMAGLGCLLAFVR